MSTWKRRPHSDIYNQEGYRMRSDNRKPPSHEVWQLTVPAWEKKFCLTVGLVPWRKLLDTKKYMHLHDNVVKWNDSASEEAFNNAKHRFWANINGLPCEISLPDPDIYIDHIDWNSKNSETDIELYEDLEKEPKSSGAHNQDEKVLILGDTLNQNQSFSPSGWGDAEEEFKEEKTFPLNPGADGKYPWEHNYEEGYEALRLKEHKEWGYNYDEWNDNLGGNGVYREHYPTWNTNSWKKNGSGWHNSGYRNSRFPSDHYQTGRGYRGRRRGPNAAYDRHALRQWNLSCVPVNNHHGSGRGGNTWSWEKPVL